MTLSPKERFLANEPRANRWNDLVCSNEFQEACDYAFLQLVHDSVAGSVYDAQARSHHLDGAKMFYKALCKLGLKKVDPEQRPAPDLDYNPTSVPAHLRPETEKKKKS